MQNYSEVIAYMQSYVSDIHMQKHIMRVYDVAMKIAKHYTEVDIDVLAISALLHDVARGAHRNKEVSHAQQGAIMAYEYLLANGYSLHFAHQVHKAILSHSLKSNIKPQSLESKLLFDADKLDLLITSIGEINIKGLNKNEIKHQEQGFYAIAELLHTQVALKKAHKIIKNAFD